MWEIVNLWPCLKIDLPLNIHNTFLQFWFNVFSDFQKKRDGNRILGIWLPCMEFQLIDSVHRYNGQKINVVYVCPHIYGAALDPPLFPWKFLSAYYTCELGWHMWKSGREGQLYQKTMSLCLTTMLTAHFHHLNETSMNNRKPLVTFSTIGAHSTQRGKIQI